MLASEWGTGQVFWSILWFTCFFIWIYLLIVVFSDIFRSHDLGGFAKFLWVIFVIFLPYLGVFVVPDRARQQDARACGGTGPGRRRGRPRVHPGHRRRHEFRRSADASSPTSRPRASSVTTSTRR